MKELIANASEYVQCQGTQEQIESEDRIDELEKRLSILESKIKD